MAKRSTAIEHPLQALRRMLGWTRETCAKFAETTPATIQNIERGRSPFLIETAQAIEAATGCRATRLLSAAQFWEKGHKWEDVSALETLDGMPFSLDAYEEYTSEVVAATECAFRTSTLTERLTILLNALQQQPHYFRIACRRLEQYLNKARTDLGVSDAALTEGASKLSKVRDLTMTLAELSLFPQVTNSPEWLGSPVTGRFKPQDTFKVTLETYPFWEQGYEPVRIGTRSLIDDDHSNERTTWRIRLPNNLQLVIPRLQMTGAWVEWKLQEAREKKKNRRKP